MAELSINYKVVQGPVTTNIYAYGNSVVIREGRDQEMLFSPEAAALLITAIEGVIFDIGERQYEQQKKDED